MRLIVLGDLHGCFEELSELLERLSPGHDDIVAAVGDFLTKGPQPEPCVELWRQRGWDAVLGNNDNAVLRAARVEGSEGDVRSDLLDYLGTLPLVLDYPALDCAVVHGGVLPHSSFTRGVDGGGLLTMREVVRDGTAWRVARTDERGTFWADLWNGDRFVVYGHTPRPKVAWHDRAVGIDTGCVYGWSLTAAVRSDDGTWTTESVPARRRWADR